MARRSCDGTGLLEAFRAAVANLEAHTDEINGLNVFPVPDGDTGTNMVATVKAALEEADAVAGQPADRIAAAISFGALMGARGNSGVITSQIFRGMSEGLAGKRRFNGLDLAYALSQGTKTAYGAVTKPVEGTILTVIREATDAAVATAERDEDIEAVLRATVEAAEKSVARTPDAARDPARGRRRRFRWPGPVPALPGRTAPPRRGRPARSAPDDRGGATAAVDARRPRRRGFRLRDDVPAPGNAGPPDRHRRVAHALRGDRGVVLVAGDSRAVKVHVHNERPDLVIGHGLTIGTLSRISVENLDNQARDVREARAESFTGVSAEPAEPSTNGTGPALTTDAPAPGSPRLAVVAVAAGDGLEAIFHDFGVAAVVRGGQSANPSTGELLEAIEETDAAEVVVLPNNPNVVLAARQVATMAKRPVTVIPTRNAAEGFAALLCLDPAEGAEANTGPMTEAARSIQTLQVTEAVRDATIGKKKVKHGQTIALDPDEGLVAVNNDRMRCILEAVGRLKPGFELVTVFYGTDAHLDEAEDVAKRIQLSLSGVDVELRHGGQPHYRYLISAE